MGGKSHVGEALDSGLVSAIGVTGVMLEDPQALGTEWLGQLGGGRDCFPFTLLALSSLGAAGSFWPMYVCVWRLSLLHAVLRCAN